MVLAPLRCSYYLGQSPGQGPWGQVSRQSSEDHRLCGKSLALWPHLRIYKTQSLPCSLPPDGPRFPLVRLSPTEASSTCTHTPTPYHQSCLLLSRHQPIRNQPPWDLGREIWPWELVCDFLVAGGRRGSMQQDRKAKTFSFIHSFTNIYCTVSCASPCTGNTIVKKSQRLPLGGDVMAGAWS